MRENCCNDSVPCCNGERLYNFVREYEQSCSEMLTIETIFLKGLARYKKKARAESFAAGLLQANPNLTPEQVAAVCFRVDRLQESHHIERAWLKIKAALMQCSS